MLVLCPVHTNIFAEEKSCKESPVGPSGPSSFKIIFTLLTEVIAVHVQFTIIYLWYLSLKGSLALCWRLFRSLVWLQVGFYELFEQFIGKGQSQSGNQSENQSGARGRVTRQSGRGITWMKTSNSARVPGKLIFYKVKKKKVPTKETTRAGRNFWELS